MAVRRGMSRPDIRSQDAAVWRRAARPPRSRVAVFASNPFLGELMEQLDGVTHQRLVASHAEDLTHLSLQELARHLQAERGG